MQTRDVCLEKKTPQSINKTTKQSFKLTRGYCKNFPDQVMAIFISCSGFLLAIVVISKKEKTFTAIFPDISFYDLFGRKASLSGFLDDILLPEIKLFIQNFYIDYFKTFVYACGLFDRNHAFGKIL